MHYIGIDYHKRYSYIVIKDEKGEAEYRGAIANTREAFEDLLKSYCPGKAVLEATRNWGLIYDWLEEVLEDVALAHPLKVRAIAEARIKTDKTAQARLSRFCLVLSSYACPIVAGWGVEQVVTSPRINF